MRPMATSLAPGAGGIRCAASELAVRCPWTGCTAFPRGSQEYLDKYRADCLTPATRCSSEMLRRENGRLWPSTTKFRLVVGIPMAAGRP